MKMPHGWTENYAICHLLEQNKLMVERVAQLEAEIARLDREKQGRRGPKPKPTAQGDARLGVTQ
jgi:hypothetical protein